MSLSYTRYLIAICIFVTYLRSDPGLKFKEMLF